MLRYSVPGDEAGLSAVWKAVFGDSDAYINTFLSYMYTPGTAACFEENGEIVSMAFALNLGTLKIPRAGAVPCGYIYAVATLPQWRGKGFAEQVTEAAAALCLKDGGAAAICPAEDSLFGYYGSRNGFSDFFRVVERRFAPPVNAAGCEKAVMISAAEYAAERERLLCGIPHIELSPRALAYQEHLCTGFFRLPDGGVFAAERVGEAVHVKELLRVNAPADGCIAASLPASGYIVREPARAGGGRRFAMLRKNGLSPGQYGYAPWVGFVFD